MNQRKKSPMYQTLQLTDCQLLYIKLNLHCISHKDFMFFYISISAQIIRIVMVIPIVQTGMETKRRKQKCSVCVWN